MSISQPPEKYLEESLRDRDEAAIESIEIRFKNGKVLKYPDEFYATLPAGISKECIGLFGLILATAHKKKNPDKTYSNITFSGETTSESLEKIVNLVSQMLHFSREKEAGR